MSDNITHMTFGLKYGGRRSDSTNYSAGFVGLASWMSLHLTPATFCGTIIRVANA